MDEKQGACPLTVDTPGSRRKAQLDALLLTLPGVSARTINGLDAYFANDKMSLVSMATELDCACPSPLRWKLRFSRDNVVPFQPGGMASTRECIQIVRANSADYGRYLLLFQASLAFVKSGGRQWRRCQVDSRSKSRPAIVSS
jgi:hypothetical protein